MLPKPDTCKGCPLYEPPYGKQTGFSYPGGRGNVLLVAEALGADEEIAGTALVGKAGYYLFQNLARVDIKREDFTLYNVCACRPPDNKLSGMSYEQEAINHCAPNLDKVIEETRTRAINNGKHFVIFTLGRTAFKRVMGLDNKSPIIRHDYLNYLFWSDKYQAFIIAGEHPAYLMRGNSHLLPPFQFAFQRAIEIARDGLELDQPTYLRDPDPQTFAQWVADYKRTAYQSPEETFLAFDIETPYKVGLDEAEVVREDDEDYTILRCSFSYTPGIACSVPWRPEYLPLLEDIFDTPWIKVGWNSENYDLPRIRAKIGVNGSCIDGMLCWHVLNSSLPKGLGYVTPFYAKKISAWKYKSDIDPAGYNAQDSDMTLRNFIGIREDLIKNGQWETLDKHIIQLNKVLGYMSGMGVLRDEKLRSDSEIKVQKLLDEVEIKMEEAVPQEARRFKVYKKTPKDLNGLIQVEREAKVRRCSLCGLVNPKKAHFKPVSARKLKLGLDNICEDAEHKETTEMVSLWAKPLEFKVSKVGLTNYQKALRHQAIISRKEKKVTFDEQAIIKLAKTYPNDPLYPRILEHREYQKLLSTYIGITHDGGLIRGGMPIGRDGRIHTTYSHNPSTLRLASQQPNLQNLPRPKGADDLATIIRNLIIADEGRIFTARDYSGIEAVLVGYFASAPNYIRLAKIDVHSFYTAYALNQLDGRIKSDDLPQLSWPDDKLIKRLGEIKKEFKKDRNELYKHLVHGANFYQGARGAVEKINKETGIQFPVKLVQRVMDIYFKLFPEIRKWHHTLWLQAEKDGFLKNPFNYIHRFNKVYDYEKIGGRWTKKPGPDANKVVAFLPQSTAAGIIKEAMLRLFFNRFEEAGNYLRLQVHDELFMEVPEGLRESVDVILKEEMEKPIKEMMLPSSYRMGDYLQILTEGKYGKRWGSME